MNKELEKKLISIRRKVHMYPELGNLEFKTASLIESELIKAGIKTKRIGKTGVSAVVGSGSKQKGPCIAIRGDIDALPVLEKNKKVYCSKIPGIMHACGHDANLTMVLGSALLLLRDKKSLKGRVKFIFQPNEESSGGALEMIKRGVLKNPEVNAILGIHVSPWIRTGVIGIKHNEVMASVDKFTIDIIGEGGHGAYPNLGKDAVVVSAKVIDALQSIVSREIDPFDPCVITVGSIHGGEKFNILCSKVTLIGTVRTLNRNLHRKIPKIIEHKVKNIVKAFNLEYNFKYEVLGTSLINSESVLKICNMSAIKALGKNGVHIVKNPSMGGEDFAEYLKYVPGCYMYIGTKKARSYPWHHELFDIDESAILKGALVLAECAKEYLSG